MMSVSCCFYYLSITNEVLPISPLIITELCVTECMVFGYTIRQSGSALCCFDLCVCGRRFLVAELAARLCCKRARNGGWSKIALDRYGLEETIEKGLVLIWVVSSC